MKKLLALLLLSVFCLNLNAWRGRRGWGYRRPYYYGYGYRRPYYYGYGYPYYGYGSGFYVNAGPIGFGIGI